MAYWGKQYQFESFINTAEMTVRVSQSLLSRSVISINKKYVSLASGTDKIMLLYFIRDADM